MLVIEREIVALTIKMIFDPLQGAVDANESIPKMIQAIASPVEGFGMPAFKEVEADLFDPKAWALDPVSRPAVQGRAGRSHEGRQT